MNSRVMDKFGELLEEGAQKEQGVETSSVSIDTVWFALLMAQSQIITLLEDIRKMMSAGASRFELIDMKEDSSDEESSSDSN